MPESVEYLARNEINALLNAIDDVRDRAVIALFLNTGIFLNELTGLNFDSVNWDKKLLSVPGNRKRDIPLNDQAFEALAKWSKERAGAKTTALFLTTKGPSKDLSARSVDHLIRKYADQAGIKRKVNAQILRNTFAVRLFSEEISSDKAAAILGITDPESINRYLQASKQPPPKTKIPSLEEMEKIDSRPLLVRLATKVFPTKPTPAKPVTEIKGAIVPNPEEVVFGREGVIAEIKANLNKNQPVLLIGPLGIGKTHLLKHIAKIAGPNTIYISSPSPTKNMLTQICDKLDPEWRKRINTRASAKELIDFIVKTKGAPPPVLIIDNLNNLKISDVDPLLALLENFTLLASADDINPRFKQVWWKFKQIELNPLSETAAKELIRYLTQNLSVSDYELLETRVLTLSNRLPLAIVDMVHQLSHEPSVTREAIRSVYHEAGVHYRDWTYAIILLWVVVTTFRFIALGAKSYEAYLLAGFGLSMIGVVRSILMRMR